MKEKKKYSIDKSPLYLLKSKRKLAAILFVSQNDLSLLVSDSLYNVFYKKVKNKLRLIEEPIGLRKKVHKRLLNILSRIETPNYLFSGKKGLSFVDNARYHVKNDYFLLLDIESFYLNSSKEYIFRFFHYVLKMSQDVAWLLSDIVTIKGHIPTGSPLSQILAYFTYSKLFDNIYRISQEKGIKFSLYVDDISLSSKNPIPKNFHIHINFLLKQVGHNLKREKIKYYSKRYYKRITGTIITPSHNLSVPNNKQKKIFDLKSNLKNGKDIQESSLFRLLGLIRYAQQVNPSFYSELYKKLNIKGKALSKGLNPKA